MPITTTIRFHAVKTARRLLCALAPIALILCASPAIDAGAATLSVPGTYKTIHEAVEAAAPSDTIAVGPGAYKENIVIKKSLALIATAGPASTTVMAATPSEPVIKAVDASGVTITGFTVTGSGVSGISIINVKDSAVTLNTAVKNSSGIVVVRSSNSVISDNAANNNENYGISIDASSNNKVERNAANSNDDKGFFINASNNNVIAGNSANMNTWNGMTIYSSNNNVIKDNMTLRNTFGLVISDSKDNEESDNTTVPNIFIIFPILLIYIGIISYLVQKNILKHVYK
ncbi:MAG: right-handed parallel beta-helix repeat-containing protein [Deltaproteobacteria bacterium]|nr:right-handed parallel beta-helix repeat-containing protein [Deltaproteobacteria bacterium]